MATDEGRPKGKTKGSLKRGTSGFRVGGIDIQPSTLESARGLELLDVPEAARRETGESSAVHHINQSEKTTDHFLGKRVAS
jgi:hypothetical protein